MMLNKTDVSNQVTGLRPKVKQAAVHIAHHLTREIGKCEKRKGDKAKKFLNRAELLRKEVLLLKEIKPDSVSRYALMMDFKEREKLLSDVNLPLKDKVMVRIATHKSVSGHVEAFRKSHPDWSSKLPQLLETLGIRAKFKKKIQKEQDKQKRKLARRQAAGADSAVNISVESMEVGDENSNSDAEVLKKASSNGKFTSKLLENLADASLVDKKVVKRKEVIDHKKDKSGSQCTDKGTDTSIIQNKSASEEEAESEEYGSASEEGDENEETGGSSEDNESEEHEGVSEDEGESEELDSASEDEGDDSASDKNEHESQRKKTVTGKNTVSKATTSSLFAEVRRFADLQKEENHTIERCVQKEPVLLPKHDLSDNDVSETEPVEDPFFVTEENRFLKTVAVKRENGEGLQTSSKISGEDADQNPTQWSVDGRKLKGNRAERRAKFLGRDMKKRRPKQFNSDGPNNLKGGERSGNANNRFGSTFNKLDHNTERNGDWKASKKQRPPSDKDSFGRRNEKTALKNQNPKQQDSGESLHPSWEAKRKQKVSVDSFQGKKIKFDD